MNNPLQDPPQTLVLCILHGFGMAPPSNHNAVSLAKMPYFNAFLEKFPNSNLVASGTEIGLPKNQIGSSEVGHMSIGAGRRIIQDLERINEVIQSGELQKNQEILDFCDKVNKSNGKCHLIGMLSDGGVHGHISHVTMTALILASKHVQVILHLITDGRDCDPKSAKYHLKILTTLIAKTPNLIKIGTICGRYYAMDRDNKWDRTEIAYNAIVSGEGDHTENFFQQIDISYNSGQFDEFISPTINTNYKGIDDGDAILITNFRPDRIIQLATTFTTNQSFNFFKRKKVPQLVARMTFTTYSKELSNYYKSVFPRRKLSNFFAEILEKNNKTQLRIAETEKFPHVTYFFNCGEEEACTNEDRILIPSPKVATYDLQPEMSAMTISETVIKAIKSNKYNFILCNFANADMVGHSGNISATVIALETIDKCLGMIATNVLQSDTLMIVTSDHGNCEEMFDMTTGNPKTSHTSNPVPFVLIGKKINKKNISLENGSLIDIAPTMLKILHLRIPNEMNGKILIKT